MNNSSESDRTPGATRPAPRFATTHWSLVQAADGSDSEEADEALAELCRTYWYPLYSFIRRRGYEASEAEDLTQSFFARFIEHRDYRSARPDKGKFRTFLLSCLKHFLANDWQRKNALKRGGRLRIESLDGAEAERRYQLEPAELDTPERIFQRSWACTVLDTALQNLRRQHEDEGKSEWFDQLKVYLTGEPTSRTQAEIGQSLGMTEDAVKSAVYRLRKQFARQLRSDIQQTLTDPSDVEQELTDLFAAFQQPPENRPGL